MFNRLNKALKIHTADYSAIYFDEQLSQGILKLDQ
jgi:hypothetical protein